MAVEASKSGLVKSLSVLFYWSAFNGIIPYSMPVYYRHKILQATILCNAFVVANMLHDIVQYHLASSNFSLSDKADSGIYKYLMTINKIGM